MKDVVDGVVHVDDEIVEWLERREKPQASSLRLFAISAVPHALSDRDSRSHSDLFWLTTADFGPGFAPKIRNWIIGRSMWSARIKLSLEWIRLSLEYGAMECRVSSIGFLFVSVLVGGQAVAQTAGTGQVGKPMQLLQLMNPDNSAAKSHKRSATKHTSKSHPAAKKHTSSKLASKESTSNGPPHAAAVDAAAAPPPVSSAPTSETAWAVLKAIRADIRNHLGGAAMQAIRADMRDQLGAAMQAIVAQNAAAVPTLLPGSAIAPRSKLIDSQTFRVASADDANVDLTTDEQGAPVTDTLVATVTAMKATITETAAPADPSDSGVAAASLSPDGNVSSTSWLLRVMGALGTAVAVGSVAWFLIGSAPLRRVSAPSVATPA